MKQFNIKRELIPEFPNFYYSTIGRLSFYNGEVIKEIKYFPGYYVSELGNVYSTKCGQELTPLAPGDNGHGYLMVKLCNQEGKFMNKKVHRLVAEAFIPNPKNLETVNHLNEDKLDNSVENLEWSSRGDNSRYSFSRPVIDLTTGAIYKSTVDASKAINAANDSSVATSIYSHNGNYKGHKFMYLSKATDESVNTIEIFSKKFEIPEILDAQDFVKLFEID